MYLNALVSPLDNKLHHQISLSPVEYSSANYKRKLVECYACDLNVTQNNSQSLCLESIANSFSNSNFVPFTVYTAAPQSKVIPSDQKIDDFLRDKFQQANSLASATYCTLSHSSVDFRFLNQQV